MQTYSKSHIKLGRFLRARREELGFTQKYVAEKLGFKSSQFISNVERGHASLPLYSLKKIIVLYDLDPTKIIAMILGEEKKYLNKFFSKKSGS